MQSAVIFYSVIAIGLFAAATSGTFFFRRYIVARDSRNATKAIERFFRKNSITVNASCMAAGSGRFTVMLESESSKRLQRTDKIERALSEHVYDHHGLELEKVYWRLLPKSGSSKSEEKSRARASASAESPQDFPTVGHTHIRHLPKVEAMETCWESFKEASAPGTAKRSS
jgi:hypothetical protein